MNSVKLCLWLMFFSAVPVLAKPVEILINGVEYPSIEAYKASKAQVRNIQGPASAQDEDFLRAKSKELGLDFDPKKVKTVTLKPEISPKVAAELKAVSYEGGVGQVKADFEQDWDNPMPKFTIDPYELGDRLGALVDSRKEPVLIISDSKKLRVMAVGKDK